MKALAYRMSSEENITCCSCTLHLVCNFKELFFFVSKPVVVDSEDICPQCKLKYDNELAVSAANRIAKLLEDSQ